MFVPHSSEEFEKEVPLSEPDQSQNKTSYLLATSMHVREEAQRIREEALKLRACAKLMRRDAQTMREELQIARGKRRTDAA